MSVYAWIQTVDNKIMEVVLPILMVDTLFPEYGGKDFQIMDRSIGAGGYLNVKYVKAIWRIKGKKKQESLQTKYLVDLYEKRNLK